MTRGLRIAGVMTPGGLTRFMVSLFVCPISLRLAAVDPHTLLIDHNGIILAVGGMGASAMHETVRKHLAKGLESF